MNGKLYMIITEQYMSKYTFKNTFGELSNELDIATDEY